MLRRSIAFRLTVLLAMASTVVLLAFGQLVTRSLERHFAEADLTELLGKLTLAQRVLARVQSAADLKAVSRQLDDALVGHDALEVTVQGPDRSVLYASRNALFPHGLLAGEAGAANTPQPALVSWFHGAHAYRGIAAHAATAIAGSPPAIVAVAVRIDQHLHFIEQFREKLWLAVLAGVLGTTALSWLAVRLGMAPVRRVTDVVRVITASRLGERLKADEVPAELTDMAHAFNGMLARLEDSVRRLSEFSADLAHELRTPISNLMTQTQVTLSKPRSSEEYREVLYSNLEDYDRLARIMSDMLFLAKADNGLITPQSEAVALGKEVRELFEFYEALAEERGIRLELEGDGSVPGDRLMLRRALTNLLSNAIRHTTRGGQVRVMIGRHDAATVSVCVENPGPTIAPEHIAHVFDRFYRTDSSRHRTDEGAGLGLSITKSIVEAHKGRVFAASSDGITRFEIHLLADSTTAHRVEK